MNRTIVIFGRRFKHSYFLTFLFLLPYFFLRIAYGSNNAHINLSLGWIQILIGAYVFMCVWEKIESQVSLLFHFFIFSAIAIHFLLVISFVNISQTSFEKLFFVFIPVYVYAFFSLLAANYFILVSPKIVEQVFLKLSLVSITISIFTFIFYSVTGASILLNHYGGTSWVRAHAFMTEPSGMAAPIAYIIAFGIVNSNYRILLAGLVGLLLSQSAVVVLISIFLLVLSLYMRTRQKLYFLIPCALSLVIIPTFFITYDCMTMDYTSDVIYKSICAIKVLWDFDNQFLINLNPRLATTLMALEFMSVSDGWFTGFGLNSSAIFMPINYDDVENSLLVSMMLYFGIWGILLYFSLAYLGYRRARQYGSSFVLFYISLLLSVTLNSAGGFYGYIIFFFVVNILIIHKGEKYLNSRLIKNSLS